MGTAGLSRALPHRFAAALGRGSAATRSARLSPANPSRAGLHRKGMTRAQPGPRPCARRRGAIRGGHAPRPPFRLSCYPMAETIEQKSHRLLTEGRLTVLEVRESGTIVASCRGLASGETHALGYDAVADRWGCTCEANQKFRRRCSHIAALQLVVTKPVTRA